MKIPNIQSQDPVFIISTGRCGSTMMAYALAIHPSLCVLNSPYPPLRTEAFVKWAHPERIKLIEKKIREKREKLIEKIKKNRLIYVEASTAAPMLIDELHRLFDAKFIHIYRDGRDFVRSGMERDWYKPASLGQKTKTLIRRRFLVETGRSTIDTLLIPPREYKTRFEKITWRWVEINMEIMQGLSLLPVSKKLTLKIEEFNRQSLINLHHFLGIEIDEDIINEMIKVANDKPNKTKKFSFLSYPEWSDAEKRRFREIAGAMMSKLGYII